MSSLCNACGQSLETDRDVLYQISWVCIQHSHKDCGGKACLCLCHKIDKFLKPEAILA